MLCDSARDGELDGALPRRARAALRALEPRMGFRLVTGSQDRRGTPIGSGDRFVVALYGDAAGVLRPGDVLLSVDPADELRRVARILSFSNRGVWHVGLAVRGPKGRLIHLDAPRKHSGSGWRQRYHVLRLRADYRAPDGRAAEAIVGDVLRLADRARGTYDYDDDFRTDVDLDGEAATRERIEHGATPPMYCTELPYTLYRLAGIKRFSSALRDALVELEDDVLERLPATRRQAIRRRTLSRMFPELGLPVPEEAEARSGRRSLVESWDALSPETRARIGREQPVVLPLEYLIEASRPDGAFCYAGTYLGE